VADLLQNDFAHSNAQELIQDQATQATLIQKPIRPDSIVA
jgi:hypothetical protein